VLVFAALLAGLAAGVGAALVLDLLGPARVVDAAHARALTGLTILARVPARGAPAALRAVELRLRGDPGRDRAVLIAGASDGDGAAELAAQLGAVIAQGGRDDAVVDLDAVDVTTLPALVEHWGCVLAAVDALGTSPAVSAALDSVDAVILVVRPRHTRVDDLEGAMALLDAAGRRPDGIIVVSGRKPRPRPPAAEPVAEASGAPRAARQRPA
jgi:Mrp family chromosome partitioning ATPase